MPGLAPETIIDEPAASTAAPATGIERTLRGFVLAILVLGMSGTTAELLLIDHDEGWQQLIPLALFASAGVVLCGHAIFRRRRWPVRAWQVVMLLFVVGGAAGSYLHIAANVEFQREMSPQARQAELLWEALQAQTPPAFAPAVMVQMGLLGLVYAYRHPLTRR